MPAWSVQVAGIVGLVSDALTYFVEGVPATQGSKIAFKHTVSGRVCVMDSNKNNPRWRAEVAFAARQAMGARARFVGAVAVVYEFFMPRPAKHYKAGRRDAGLRPDAPKWPLFKNDWEKLSRSVGDAMTGHVYDDDGQICFATVWKSYADGTPPGVRVTVNALGDRDGNVTLPG